MKYTEELLWILDKVGNALTDDEKYKLNIDFVHSIGQKCDCVGWSELKLDSPDADEIIEKIKKHCKENGWKARGVYIRKYAEVESEWYQLETGCFKDTAEEDYFEIKGEDGKDILWLNLKAYHETNSQPKEWGNKIFVSEKIRRVCLENGVEGLDFCWIEDKGKYKSNQYFAMYSDKLIPRIACDRDLKKTDNKRIEALGGYLPELAEFMNLQNISLPDCYFAQNMPESGIAYVFCSSTDDYCGRNTVLIHKDIAKILVNEKVLTSKMLTPVPVVNELPGGYVIDKTKVKPRPDKAYIEEMLSAYERIKNTERPVRRISEKEVLKLLRRHKRERKEDFLKAMSKDESQSIADTEFVLLLPYYLISNGCFISDEYEFLSYDVAVGETAEFTERLMAEETGENKPKGIVFAKCPDGDVVLLLEDEKVIRFSHEVPESVEDWKNLAEFFWDALMDFE